jgi:hypothetical protein
MLHQSTRISLVLLATCAAVALGACVDALPPGTSLADAPLAAAPGESLVTFVRPDSSCDRGEYAVIVDDHGRFVGNLGPGMQMQVPVAAGLHAFYGWGNVDYHIAKEPGFNAVNAVRVQATANEDVFVAVEVACGLNAGFDMYSVVRGQGAWSDVERWLHATRRVSADRTAGQLALESKPIHLRANLELGARRLGNADADAARKARDEAFRKEDTDGE